MLYKNIYALTLFFLLGGCANLPNERVEREVGKLAEEQGAGKISWRRTKEADNAVKALINDALSAGLKPDDSAQLALLSNPDLQVHFETLGIERADYLSAASAPNSVLQWQRLTQSGVDGAAVEWGLTRNILQLILWPTNRRVAKLDMDGAQLRAADEVVKLALRARTEHMHALAQQHIVELQAAHTDLARLAFELAGRFREAGNLPLGELEEERTRWMEARRALDEEKLQSFNDELNLSRTLGILGLGNELKLRGQLSELPEKELSLLDLERLALQRRLDLRAAYQSTKARLVRLGSVRWARFTPSIEVGTTTAKEDNGSQTSGLTASLELSLFSQQEASLAASDSLARLAMRRAESLAMDVRVQVRQAQAEMAVARARVEAWKNEVIPARAVLVDNRVREFFFMLKGPFDPMRAKQAALEAEIEYTRALRDYWEARARLALATGDLSLSIAEKMT